ncbi:MAG: type II toxin-antitoxin system RelE/ParE family toxin [Planctomycetales bacterium]|nr:type II toxin-antitoxin system RelE/ParE family toxin [Planctomycetales bacterium]
MAYAVLLNPSARKDLAGLDPDLQARVVQHLEPLAENPRPQGVKKLRGPEGEYRIRVGDYRVIFQIEDRAKIVRVTAIRHRSDAY